mmetsp:Transcript_29232/g.94304  ORF Transcript_29232/g.94304 Transcript_29232/m.94304 type:complete len:754 (-) Transcript_29232:525-2786(-)
MVNFGKTLEDAMGKSRYPSSAYLDYGGLKRMIYALEVRHLREPVDENAMSLSVRPATNAAAMPDDEETSDDEIDRSQRGAPETTHEHFLVFLEKELKKMDRFTHEEVSKIRKSLNELENLGGDADRCAEVEGAFLEIEQYVNLNVTAVRKLLKKHDKVLPTLPPIKAFYLARMHDMRWVRNDYSDVVVRLSRLYNAVSNGNDDEDQDAPARRRQYDDASFVRTTSKFWVKPDDLSAVKLAISKHLPVFLQPGMSPSTEKSKKDSQLVNSVYLDSSTLELYHQRLEKSPGACALRLRWYGTGEPTLVFVERKTHHDAWTGEESVKERFAVAPDQVPKLLAGRFDVDAHLREKQKKKQGEDATLLQQRERRLVTEVLQLISTKRLVPTVRSQCTRCAFQLEHTNAVRASVDTNLCLISELTSSGRWYRDPNLNIPSKDITRFPFAVLEIKLALGDSDELPNWVRDLVSSKALIPCHKFSKFIHGCAVLLPDEIQAAPYWIDDPSLRASIVASGPTSASILKDSAPPLAAAMASQAQQKEAHDGDLEVAAAAGSTTTKTAAVSGGGRRFDRFFSWDLGPTDDDAGALLGRRALEKTTTKCCPSDLFASEFLAYDDVDDFYAAHQDDDDDDDVSGAMQKLFPLQKIEPKLFLAAERTFIHWLHAAVVLASIGSAIFAKATKHRHTRASVYAAALCLAACALVLYAMTVLRWRQLRIQKRLPTEWGDPIGPLVLGGLTIALLASVWVVEVINFALSTS